MAQREATTDVCTTTILSEEIRDYRLVVEKSEDTTHHPPSYQAYVDGEPIPLYYCDVRNAPETVKAASRGYVAALIERDEQEGR